MKATLQTRYAAGLAALGYKPAPTKSTKYLLMQDRGGLVGWPQFIFLGKAGSVRVSPIARRDFSHPASSARKTAILKGAPV